jgi:putative Holliday junction resolvase
MPKNQTFVAFDFGITRIGMAVGQTVTQTASPIATLIAKKGIPVWQDVDKLIKIWNPHGLVLGLPLNHDGTRSDFCDRVETFGQELSARFDLPIHYFNEHLSSFSAQGLDTQKKERIDDLAAVVILENFLAQGGFE